jgi:hypothetical protein
MMMNIDVTNIITDNVVTLLNPIFTLLFVASLLTVFMQMRFPIPARHTLFVGGIILLVTIQLFIVNNQLADALSLSTDKGVLIQFIGVIVLQVGAIAFSFVMERKKKK